MSFGSQSSFPCFSPSPQNALSVEIGVQNRLHPFTHQLSFSRSFGSQSSLESLTPLPQVSTASTGSHDIEHPPSPQFSFSRSFGSQSSLASFMPSQQSGLPFPGRIGTQDTEHPPSPQFSFSRSFGSQSSLASFIPFPQVLFSQFIGTHPQKIGSKMSVSRSPVFQPATFVVSSDHTTASGSPFLYRVSA